MPENRWPFGSEGESQGAQERQRSHDTEAERARWAQQTALRRQARHDRLIVGGRAHARKSGLS